MPELLITGRRELSDYWPARPTTRRIRDVAVISVYGSIDTKACDEIIGQCGVAMLNDSIRGAVFKIASLQGSGADIFRAAMSVHELASCKPVEAFIEYAEGAALLIALAAGKVTAATLASIGNLGVYCPVLGSEQRWDPKLTWFAKLLRPWVPTSTWCALLDGTLNGEQAEAAGIVDHLANCSELELALAIAKK